MPNEGVHDYQYVLATRSATLNTCNKNPSATPHYATPLPSPPSPILYPVLLPHHHLLYMPLMAYVPFERDSIILLRQAVHHV